MKLKPPPRQAQLVREGDAVRILMEVAIVSTDADGVALAWVFEHGNRSPALDGLIAEAKQMLEIPDRKARARRKAFKVVKSE